MTAEDRQEAAIRKIIIGAVVFVIAMVGLAACAMAQEHRHPPTEEWVKVPASKVEYDRDTPDGRSHLCGRRYGFNGSNDFTVFCFIAGSAG